MPSVADLIIMPVLLGESGFIYLRHSESTNACALEKDSAFWLANAGFHSNLAVTIPPSVCTVVMLPLGVVILNCFFCAILRPSNPPMWKSTEPVIRPGQHFAVPPAHLQQICWLLNVFTTFTQNNVIIILDCPISSRIL